MARHDLDRQLIETSATTVRTGRAVVGWSQRELSRRSGVSQSVISGIERGHVRDLRLSDLDRLMVTLGVRYWLAVEHPSGFGRRPSDAVHAHCSAYSDRRLRADGWLVEREVEIGGDRSRGWIDILAFHPASGMLLVLELKTELHDLGAVERSLNWYQREAWAAARRFGWHPQKVAAALLVLQSTENDRRINSDRAVFAAAFPGRAGELRGLLEATPGAGHERYLAMIDPHSRRAVWLRATTTDGRRSPAPYVNYVDAVRRLAALRSRT